MWALENIIRAGWDRVRATLWTAEQWFNHGKRYGAVYLLVALFLATWGGQLWAQWQTVQEDGWAEFWAATFENWQSEFLQLALQAMLIASLTLGPRLFAADRSAEARDLARLEQKIDSVLRRLPPEGRRET